MWMGQILLTTNIARNAEMNPTTKVFHRQMAFPQLGSNSRNPAFLKTEPMPTVIFSWEKLKSRCSTAFQKATKTNTRTPTFTAAAVDLEQSGLQEEEPSGEGEIN
jgi:hypothetical protein